jgi:DNA ligase-1
VRDVRTGAAFSIGSGFTQEMREQLWQVRGRLTGQFVKYRYFPTGSKNAPRFPTFLGFRDPADFDQ